MAHWIPATRSVKATTRHLRQQLYQEASGNAKLRHGYELCKSRNDSGRQKVGTEVADYDRKNKKLLKYIFESNKQNKINRKLRIAACIILASLSSSLLGYTFLSSYLYYFICHCMKF